MLDEVTVKRLKAQKIPINFNLPKIEKKQFRSSIDVARRINILGIFIAISDDSKSIPFFYELIQNQGMINFLTKEELNVLKKGKISKQQEIDFSWYKESLYTLTWSLGVFKKIENPNKEANLNILFKSLPPEIELKEFLNNSMLISDSDILKELEFYYALHWAKRHPKEWGVFGKGKFEKYNISIVRERRRALEWLVDDNSDWDEISLDT